MTPIPGVVLDHVALAAERQDQLWPRYAGDLAGRWLGGGWQAGFGSAQVAYANGMKVEALEPYQPEANDFLRRFLDRNGPGPHHFTFKVPDIQEALETAGRAGYTPVGVDLRDPGWKEAFLHPKEATGVVVQIAWSAGDWEGPQRADLPEPRTETPATLVHVAHEVASLDDGRRLFGGLLGGTDSAAGDGWVELAWPGPGRIRLVEDPGLDGRAGRIAHLTFRCERPEDVAGAVAQPDGTYVIPPEDNLGTRLVLWSSSAGPAKGPDPGADQEEQSRDDADGQHLGVPGAAAREL
jgi:methylmalonyl-CoA/ethylmalonyl-CoA epimerase